MVKACRGPTLITGRVITLSTPLGDVPCVVETRDGLTCQKVSSLTYAASEPEGIARVKPLSCLRVLHFERLLFC